MPNEIPLTTVWGKDRKVRTEGGRLIRRPRPQPESELMTAWTSPEVVDRTTTNVA